MNKKILFLLLCFLIANFAFTQEALKSVEEEYYDFLALQGLIDRPTLGYRTLSDSVWELEEDVEHIWQGNNLGKTNILWEADNKSENWFSNGIFHGVKYKLYGPEWFNSYNTDVPYGQNDGALWQGVGYNTSLTGGVRFEGFGFEATFKPQITWSQNKEFEINTNIYRNPYLYSFSAETVNHTIDMVQKYGDKSLFSYSFGDSEIRWNWYSLTFGFGTQSPWLGPAILNPMLGSNNATPYPKFDAGLRKTPITIPRKNLYIGDIEVRVWTGMLSESKYFDNNPQNNHRMLNAVSASYAPSFIPGLTFGLNRIIMTYWKPENFAYLIRLFSVSRANATGSGNDEDQKFSLFLDWKFEKIGFEVYGEFGRDDSSKNEITYPFHTAIYTVGANQIIPLPRGLKSQLTLEWSNFEMSQNFQFEWPYLGYYQHGFVSQGYTNNGQIIGAGSGAFGNSQYIDYKVYFNKGYIDLFLHRFCPNNNSVYSMAVYTIANTQSDLYKNWYINYETYMCFGINGVYFINSNFYVNPEYTFVRILQRNYENRNINQHHFSINLKYSF